MSLSLQRLSIPSKFAAQFGGMVSLTSASVAALAWSGVVRFEVARPELAVACLVASGGLAAAWTWWVGRSVARPVKNALHVAEQAAASGGPLSLTSPRGDEGQRLVHHLTHIQSRQVQLLRASAAIKAQKEDQQDEMAAWADDTLRLRCALDAAEVDALVTDEDGVILFVTRSLAKLLKAHRDSVRSVLPTLDLDRLVGQKWHAVETSAAGAQSSLILPGLHVNLATHPVRDRHGSEVGQVVVWHRVAQAPLADGSDAVHSADTPVSRWMLDAMSVPAHMVDQAGQICHTNAAFRALLRDHANAFKAANADFQPDQPEGHSAGMLYADPSAELARLGELVSAVNSRKVLGGRTYNVLEKPVLDQAGKVVGVLCQWEDCTDAWLAERAFAKLAERVAQGDYAKPASMDGITGVYREIGLQLNRAVLAMNETSAPVRQAIEELGNALAQVSQSTLAVQEAIAAVPQQPNEGASRSTAMLADRAGAVLAQMAPTVNRATELLHEPLQSAASADLAATAAQLQDHALRLQAMVASYRLAVGAKKSGSADGHQSALVECTA